MNYPKIVYDCNKICHNALVIKDKCKEKGIEVSAVIKGIDSKAEIVAKLLDSGFDSYADSRTKKIKDIVNSGVLSKSILIRIPMLSEVKDVVKYVNISFNSEISVLKALNTAAKKNHVIHNIVLMVDLGDLREGFIEFDQLLNVAKTVVEDLNSLKLVGIATNLGCYGAIKPSVENLSLLVDYGKKLEDILNIKLSIISGGGTSTLPLVFNNTIPKGINHLRCGEAILSSNELSSVWGVNLPELKADPIYLEAEIIEIKNKPSHPIGEMVVDAFGQKPAFNDIGIRKKALLALGKKDIGSDKYISAFDKDIVILGSSSDHLIVDITDAKDYKVGDILKLHVEYPAMLYASSCDCVYKKFI
ncbi:MAG: alanine racemase [Filifactoraceae bacterium]